jgi:uncharacterized protein (TIGR00369 family)
MQDNAFLKAAQDIHSEFQSLSGLDFLRAVIANKRSYPFGELLKMKVVGAGEGFAEIEAMPAYEFYNPMMRVHGGYLATLMDAALGSAVISKLQPGTGAGTVNLNISYVRKVDVESGLLHARANVLHSGRTMLTAEAQIHDAAGELCVHGTGTFLVYPK